MAAAEHRTIQGQVLKLAENAAKRKPCCAGCKEFQAGTIHILKRLAFYAAQSEPALDEVRTEHHDVNAYLLAEGTDMSASHARFGKKGKSSNSALPPSIQRLMRSDDG